MRESPDLIVLADIHLSQRPPVARSAEPNWFAAMQRQLDELNRLAGGEPGIKGTNIPIVYAGDIFHKWDSPAELINFALRHLPHGFAVPGQHDLPHHRYEDMERSAFWTLVRAGKLTLLEPGKPTEIGIAGKTIRLTGFPWGFSPTPVEKPHDLLVDVAVVHRYCWKGNTGARWETDDTYAGSYTDALRGYDLAVFGDNHTPFSCRLDTGCKAWNCGSFYRRTSAEKEHKPSVGLVRLTPDGIRIERKYLDVSADRFLEDMGLRTLERPLGSGIDTTEFLAELNDLSDAALDFADMVRKRMDALGVPSMVRTTILGCLENQ